MKAFLFFTLLTLSFQIFAQDTEATCGEVKKITNGKILKRLQPGLFELNPKFVLKTKFNNHVILTEQDLASKNNTILSATEGRKTVYTAFSIKEKFLTSKNNYKEARKNSDSVWACAGRISISLRYEGSHVYVSDISLEDAIAKFKKQYQRHAPRY